MRGLIKAAFHQNRRIFAPENQSFLGGLAPLKSERKLTPVWLKYEWFILLESRQRRTKGSVVGEEWCQNAAPLRWYTKNVFAQSKMILSRAWLHDTVSCAAWNDARKGVYLKPLFKTPCSNCYWGWSKPIMLDYRDISLMESVPLMWGPVTASPVRFKPMTILEGGAPLIIDIQYITARIPRLARAGPPIPPMLVLKHGELR